MKKTVLFFLILFTLIPVFALKADIQLNCGYGFIEGTRSACPEKDMNNLKARGIEAGFMFSVRPSEKWGIDAYFDYLFALKGAYAKKNAPSPSDIPSNMKYTDYKAGLGLHRKFHISGKDYIRLGCGLNFAGISNHTYIKNPKIIKNQTKGNKVTSFGFYANIFYGHRLSEKLAIGTGMHSCINPFGFIRNFDSTHHKWVNDFDTSVDILCYSVFAQAALIYSF